MKLHNSTTLRRIEAHFATLPLMQRAGAAAAEWAAELALANGKPILVLAGPGNNGGDAFAAACDLLERSFLIDLVFRGDPGALPPDAAAACQRFLAASGRVQADFPANKRPALIIDGLFGIGLKRAIDGHYADWIAAANQLAETHAIPLLALDCPSGLNADTGQADGPTIRATHTITFISGKPGLLTAAGPDHCGVTRLAPLDLDISENFPAEGRQISVQDFAVNLKKRAKNTHKGSFGSAGILGGAPSMSGAALLAGRAALKLGAGRVYLGLLDPQAAPVDPMQPELMLRTAADLFNADLSALACGPGLGTSEAAIERLTQAIAAPLPLVLDADALNLLACHATLKAQLTARRLPHILTPHPAEAARLLGCTVAEIQSDRMTATRELAHQFQALVALKGCGTVIAAVDGLYSINSTGNPGMATAGMGDVLTGMIVALLAQGWPADKALAGAVHLHGAAADHLLTLGIGPIGLTAGEVIDSARGLLNRLSR